MATKRYQVVAACALVPVTGPTGTQLQTLYRGSVFEGDPEHFRVKHNADSGYIVELAKGDVAGVDAAGEPLVNDERRDGSEPGGPPPETPLIGATPNPEPEAKGDAAKKPAQSDSKADWVTYAVANGMDKGEAEKASKQDLIDALK